MSDNDIGWMCEGANNPILFDQFILKKNAILQSILHVYEYFKKNIVMRLFTE